MIIDAHCHYGKGDGLTGPWDTSAPIKDYLKWADEYGITHINLFAAFHSNYMKANKEVALFVQRNPKKFSGFIFLHAQRDAGKVFQIVKKFVGQYGFKGIKLHRHDAHISREICEVAQAFNLPVLYDVMGKVEYVDLLARNYPKVNFIIPHLSSFADSWKAQIGFIPMLKQFDNIYTDTSGVRRFDLLKRAFDEAGPQKILFGSDGPWLHPGVELEKIYALHASPQGEKAMLSQNFLRLTQNIRIPKRNIATSLRKEIAIPEHEDPWELDATTF
jgi:predicted TIM-barrel fold metal-dependent hydrolase